MDLPKAQKMMEQNFNLGPRLGFIAHKGPKMAQNLKIQLLLQFLSYDLHLLGDHGPTQGPENDVAKF